MFIHCHLLFSGIPREWAAGGADCPKGCDPAVWEVSRLQEESDLGTAAHFYGNVVSVLKALRFVCWRQEFQRAAQAESLQGPETCL